jgi:hypothetical protein
MWLGTPDSMHKVAHKGFWYDEKAILSRKPSVRFRRTVDLMLPVFNEMVRSRSGCAIWRRAFC